MKSIQFRTLLSAFAVAMILPIAAYAVEATAAKPAPKAHLASHAKHHPAIDLNSASKEELMTLPGVTDEVAEKIIAGRPYKSKAELTKKSILTKAEYGKVRNRIVAHQEKSAEMKSDKAPETKAAETTPESK